MNLKGKIAVIVGATGGIGSCIADELSKNGSKLILVGRSDHKLKKLSVKLKQDSIIASIPADFSKSSKLSEVAEKITSKVNKVDILINAAGIGYYKSLENLSLAEWESEMAINVTAPVFFTKNLLSHLKKSEQSVVINLGSGMGEMPVAGRLDYNGSKFALRGATLSIAEELKETNVKVIHIMLGSTLTEFGPMTLEEKQEENLQGKTYFTPEGVSQKTIEIIKKGDYQPEIKIYPIDYLEKGWWPS